MAETTGTFFGGSKRDPRTRQTPNQARPDQRGVRRVSAEYEQPTVDRTFRQDRAEQTLSGQMQTRAKKVEQQFEAADQRMAQYAKNTAVGRGVRNVTAVGTRKIRKKYNITQKALVRAKVSVANVWINSWVIFWYLTFQLPFAIISATGIGMAYATYALISNVIGGTATELVISTLWAAGETMSTIIETAANIIFGVSFDPIIIFAVPFALVMLFGFLQLLLCWFVYSIMGIRSLSGQSGAAKILLFLLAGIGTAIPILNLFPLILLWTGLVWLRPR